MSASRPDSDLSTTPSESGGGRRVLLLVSGGIAVYKVCTVVRRLVDAGCSVRVAMTHSATHFVTPMTFEVLSGQSVGTTLWGEGGEEPLDHVQWAREADLILVAPATANFLAKMAHGMADDLCSTLVTAGSNKPTVVSPAMNDQMWRNPAHQDNLALLKQRGIEVIEPGSGSLACGVVSEGRLAEPEEIVAAVLQHFAPGPLSGQTVVISAGGSREAIDAVRYIGNRSTGRMGMALAAAARDMGATVKLLLGATELAPPEGVELHRYESATELSELCSKHAPSADMVLMSAAVSDYRPENPRTDKQKKEDGVPEIRMQETEDILAGLGKGKPDGQKLIGFALEAGGDEVVEQNAAKKLKQKNLDLVCGNRADVEGEGFAGARNRIYLLDASGRSEWVGPMDKTLLARRILERALRPLSAKERA